jgi:hypothetical protein
MERRCWFSESRNPNAPAVNRARSEPNAFADRQGTRTRARSGPAAIFAGLEHPFVEPYFQPAFSQAVGRFAHDRFVPRTMAEEPVEWEWVAHFR